MRLDIAGIGTRAGCEVSHPRESLFPSESTIITFNNNHPLGSNMAEKATIGEDTINECDNGWGGCDCPIPSYTIPIAEVKDWVWESGVLGDDTLAMSLTDNDLLFAAHAAIQAMGGRLNGFHWVIPCRESNDDLYTAMEAFWMWCSCRR